MAETSDTDNTDLLSGPATILRQRRVDRDTSAEHWSSIFGSNGVRDLENEVRRYSSIIGIATVRLIAIGIFTIICANHSILAVVLFAVRTLLAVGLEARGRLSSDANAVSNPGRC